MIRKRHPVPVLVTALLVAGLPGAADAQQDAFNRLAAASLTTIDGVTRLAGLRDTVHVLRDAAGVPHIYAKNVDDLFFAQGYVQAQDRLWQMDMYRRTFEGELSEIHGPAMLRHDRLARLLKFRKFDDAEFSSYHPEGRRIFEAFARGVNAFIAQASDNLPVEFKLTGLSPGVWRAETPLLRTQTAMPTADARSELTLARNVAQYGVDEANRRARPDPYRALTVPRGVDVTHVDQAVLDALGGMRGSGPRPPLLPEYQRWEGALPRENLGAQENSPGSNNWVVSGRLTASGRVIVANDPHRNVSNPSIRYIVHLSAPGWDMIGATEPPLPGVAIGHNGRIAWGLTIVGTDQSDVYVEQVNPANRNQVRWQDGWEPLRVLRDTIRVKGQAPVIVDLKFSRHGPVFYEDTARNLAYAMRSTMHEPGSAGYLSSLRYHAVRDCRQFLDAQVYYKAPTENMICGDADGNIAWQASALSPRRSGWDGRLPVPGNGEFEWTGFRDDLPREFNPDRGWIATANHNIHPPGYEPPLFFKTGNSYPRFERLAELLPAGRNYTVADFQRMQHDSWSASAARDIELFKGWTSGSMAVERLRQMLAGWDARYTRASAAAALYSHVNPLIDANVRAPSANAAVRRQALEAALAMGADSLRREQGGDPAGWRWGRINRSEMPHSLVRAYDIPAVERTGGAGTVAAIGATYRQIIDFANLDASMATNVPGQSGQPGSPFYANLAESFGRAEYFPLLFTRSAVEQSATHRLRLVPAGGTGR
jgi:penicillin amidase